MGEWKQVPDWFPHENQGAALAVMDLDGDGVLEMVVLQVDNPPGQNQAFYKVGKKLQVDGAIGGGWTSWLGVPGWFSWENQGAGIAAGIAAGNLDDGRRLIALSVDSPDGANTADFRVPERAGDPQTEGEWRLLPYLSEVLAVHAPPWGRERSCSSPGPAAPRCASRVPTSARRPRASGRAWSGIRPSSQAMARAASFIPRRYAPGH
ncbi:MAG: hypothetical protein ACRDJG_06345 [Actinomycetota bacterium]